VPLLNSCKLSLCKDNHRIDDAKWSEGKAMMGTLATAIRAWNAET
jgi:hypothetical protein